MTVVEIVERERARLRATHVAALVALTVATTALVVGAAAWLLADARWIVLPRATPLVVWLVVISVDTMLVTWAIRRVRAELARASIAAAIEREQELRAGALRGVLEVGQQSALARRADRALADRLADRGPMLAPRAQRASRRRAVQTLAVAAVTLALLLWAAPTVGDGLLAIRRLIAAWRGTLVPQLTFKDIPAELLRGEPLTVKLSAAGRRHVRLSARSPGEGWRVVDITVDSTSGIASTDLGPVRGDVLLVASDGRDETDTTVVRVTDRPFVGGVVLRATYPAYLGRVSEGLPVGEPARIPQGTVIDVSGRASTALRSVYVRGEHDSTLFGAAGQSFTGRIVPRRSERLDWFAFGTRGAIADVPLPIDVELIPDSVPHVDLVSPATDTLMATGADIPLQVTVTDDHGVAQVDLESERDGAPGRSGVTASQRLGVSVGTVWNGTPTVNLAARELQPGDVLRLRIVAIDNSPWAQRGVSRELVIRVPTMEERRSIARAAADSAVSAAQAAIAAQKSLEQRTDEASRERGSRDQTNGSKGAEGTKPREKDMSFESAEKARALTQEQKQLAARVDSLRQSARKLEEHADA